MHDGDWVAGLILFCAAVGFGWVLPIKCGVDIARRKGYSSAWMFFGIYPITGWLTWIILALLPARTQCASCGGFIGAHFRLCPVCHNPVRPTDHEKRRDQSYWESADEQIVESRGDASASKKRGWICIILAVIGVVVLLNIVTIISSLGRNYPERIDQVSTSTNQSVTRKDPVVIDRPIIFDPKLALVYYSRGFALSESGQHGPAIADYTEAIRHNPRFAPAYLKRGQAQSERNEYDKAIVDFGQAIRLDPNLALAYHFRGIACCNKGDYDKAIADYDEAIRLEPQCGSAYSNRAICWTNKGEFDRAIADYDLAIWLAPQDAISFYNRAHVWSRMREYDKAIADYDETIRLDPQFAYGYYDRGNAWHLKGDHNKAISDFDRAIQLAPQWANAYDVRGTAWYSKGEYDKAIADYEQAIRLDPTFAPFYNSRAWLLATCPDPAYRDGKKAVESATRACELTQWKDPMSVDTLAAAYA